MTELKPKAPSESFVEKTEIVLPSDANNLGTVFGGRVMAWVDITAAIAAQRHCRKTVVTASMDDVHFLAPIKAGHVAELRGHVVYSGRTSVDVLVTVDSEDPKTGERRRCCQAWLTFVALDDAGNPSRVPTLEPATPEDEARFKEASERRALRLERKRKYDRNAS